jgi:toxin ParE1/3/4
MPLKVRPTKRARADLDAIWTYIHQQSPVGAEKVIAGIDAVFRQLSDLPDMGRPRPELASELRSMIVGRHIVFYRHDDRVVRIIRVLHSARDIGPTMFESDD